MLRGNSEQNTCQLQRFFFSTIGEFFVLILNPIETDVTSAPDFLVPSEAVVRVKDDYTSAASFQHLLQSNKRIEIIPYKYKCIM